MRRIVVLAALALSTVAGVGVANAAPTPPPQAKGVLKTATGEAVGTVILTQLQDGRVFVASEVKGLPAGDHGLTLREKGACTPFDAAGAAFGSAGFPKFTVKPDKTGTFETYTTNVTIAPTDKTVLDTDGTAVIITAFGDESQKAACAVLEPVAVPAPVSSASTTAASVELKNAAGEGIGSATFTQNSNGSVRVQAQMRNLPPGAHAIHIHQFGQCAPVFGAAGEHHNPLNKTHGSMSKDPAHAADLPSFTAGADGTANFDVTSTLFTLTPSDVTILDSDGSALIVHAKGDDYMTDPTGMADGRLACGVIQASAAGAQPAPQPANPSTPNVPAQLPSTGGSDNAGAGAVLALLLIGGGLMLRRRER